MAIHCGNCNGTDTAALADRYQCWDCGATTPYEAGGEVVPAEAGMTTTKKRKE